MKVWYKKDNTNFDTFISEQFLLIGEFCDDVLSKNKDFANCRQWKEDISKVVEFTSIEECDVILFPDKLNPEVFDYLEIGKQYNKHVLAFYNDDFDKHIAVEGLKLFRTSFDKSTKKSNEFSMPAWSADLLQGNIVLRERKTKPTVGFCGALTHSSRTIAIDHIINSKKIESNIMCRSHFWGGKIHDNELRQAYINNTLSSDLVLCCRGQGNFSYRLYETLSLGRIPIIVDCDTPLPCSDIIDWDRFIITTPDNVVSDILEFWKKHEMEYKMLQLFAREVYEKILCPSGFAQYLDYHIKDGCNFY